MRAIILGLTLTICLAMGSCSRTQNMNAPAGTCAEPVTAVLQMPLKAQETEMWCWAASGEMIMGFLQHNVSQCLQANNELGREDCCSSDKPEPCVSGGWPEFQKYNFTFRRTTDAPLSWSQVRDQIACKSSPFAFSWHWRSLGGHMMVVRGYTTEDGVNYVYVSDPWPPVPGLGEERILTYDEYVSGSTHSHWDDFYDIKYQ